MLDSILTENFVGISWLDHDLCAEYSEARLKSKFE